MNQQPAHRRWPLIQEWIMAISRASRPRSAWSLLFFPVLGVLALGVLLSACENYLSEIPDDLRPPTVTSFTLAPDSIDITHEAADVSATLGLRGELAVDSVSFYLKTDGGETACAVGEPASGDAASGSWACTVPFATDARSGVWTAATLMIYPQHGEVVTVSMEDLEEAGYPYRVRVIKVSEIAIEEPETTTLGEVGDTLHLSATALDEDGGAMPEIEIAWSSADTTIATVSAEGIVTAVGEGTVSLTAEGAGLEASLEITVSLEPEIEFIVVLPQEVTLREIGDLAQLNATAYDAFENVIEGVEFAWQSSDEAVARIDESGFVSAVGPGTATITASIGEVSGSATVTVEEPEEYWDGWVAVGSSDGGDFDVVTSADGVSWSGAKLPFGSSGMGMSVATDGTMWVVVGSAGSGDPVIATSTAAETWRAQESELEYASTVAWNDGLWVVGGNRPSETGSPIVYSEDGESWSTADVQGLDMVTDIATDGTTWIATGYGSSAIATSSDGKSWTEGSIGLVSASAVEWNGEVWVIAGVNEDGTVRILTSPDGVEWSEHDSPIEDQISAVAWNGATWVVVGYSSSQGEPHIAVSEDGTEWTVQDSPFDFGAETVAWNGKRWVAGGAGSSVVATSKDGLEWDGQNAPIGGRVYGVAWGGSPVNQAPRATIIEPQAWAVVESGEEVTFEATAEDAEDGELSGTALVWTSDVDGELGTGTTFTSSDLSEGTHTITLSVTDSDGAITRRQTVLEVVAAPAPEIYLMDVYPRLIDLDHLEFPVPTAAIFVVPDEGSIPLDTLDVTLTGPAGEAYTCALANTVSRLELESLGFTVPEAAPQAWGCAITFGIDYDFGGSAGPGDPVVERSFNTLSGSEVSGPDSEVSWSDSVPHGTWRVSEVRLGADSAWHTLDEAALGDAGYDLEVEVTALGPRMFYFSPDVIDLNRLWAGDGMAAAQLFVVPPVGSPEIESMEMVFTGPNGETPACNRLWHAEDWELRAAGIEVEDGAPQPWTCLHLFGVDYDYPDPGSPDEIALGYWRVTEIDLVYEDGSRDYFDEDSLSAASYDLGVRVMMSEAPISWIYVDPQQPVINAIGESVRLSATAYGGFENEIYGVEYTWTSLDPDVATVDSDGKVTARSYGVARIQAEARGVIGEATVQVAKISPGIAWDTVAVGRDHSCGIAEGTAYCWGSNEDGQLGTSMTTGFSVVPTRVSGDHHFTAISAGDGFTVALTHDGGAYAWGRNDVGQLGDGTTESRSAPVQVSGNHSFSTISAGDRHVLALSTGVGHLYAWGSNLTGQLGNDSGTGETTTPDLIPGASDDTLSFEAVSAGSQHSLALRDGVIYSWGANVRGQVGDGTTIRRSTPVAIDMPGVDFASISAGSVHNIALSVDGQAYAWGYGAYGQIGNGTQYDTNASPVQVGGNLTFESIEAGGSSSFGITADGTAYAWGLNSYGQLGIGKDFGSETEPTPVVGGLTFASISAGALHTIGLTTEDTAFGSGSNRWGEVGDGTLEGRSEPAPVSGPDDR